MLHLFHRHQGTWQTNQSYVQLFWLKCWENSWANLWNWNLTVVLRISSCNLHTKNTPKSAQITENENIKSWIPTWIFFLLHVEAIIWHMMTWFNCKSACWVRILMSHYRIPRNQRIINAIWWLKSLLVCWVVGCIVFFKSSCKFWKRSWFRVSSQRRKITQGIFSDRLLTVQQSESTI